MAVSSRFLHSKPSSSGRKIPQISDPQFREANDALDAVAKSIRREGKVGGVVLQKSHNERAHRNAI